MWGCRDAGMRGCRDASPNLMVPLPTTSLCTRSPSPQPQRAEASSAQHSSAQLLWPRWGTWQNEGRGLPSRAEPSSSSVLGKERPHQELSEIHS